MEKEFIYKIKDLVEEGKTLEETLNVLAEGSVSKEEIESYYDTFKLVNDYPYKITELDSGYSEELKPNACDGKHSLMKGLIKKLKEKNIYSEKELEDLREGSIKILTKLSRDAKKDGVKKGLVMGYVQSGKTTSIEGLIAAAIDNGVNLVVVLSGVIENLRLQTLNRLEKDFYFRAIKRVHFENRLTQEELLKKTKAKNAIVTVCLKNSTRITKLREIICDAMLSGNLNVLIIDDEADQASLNTCVAEDERTKINEEITYIANNTEFKSINYVGYTATPYGNFLNESSDESLYPKDFIVMLPKSPKYIGPKEIFGYNSYLGLDIVRMINDNEIKMLKQVEKFEINDVPPNMKRAIEWFICTVANFRYNKKVSPVSMLIHTNGTVKSHEALAEAISDWFRKIDKNILINNCRKVYVEETDMFTKDNFKSVMPLYGLEVKEYAPFNELEPYIREIINEIKPVQSISKEKVEYHKGIHLAIDNSRANSLDLVDVNDYIRLRYPKKEDNVDYATAFLVIGGNTLARGLTIEGLTSTYFARDSKMVDTLMQMGRWFGYRIGYELLPRIWISSEAYFRFRDMVKIEEELRNDLKKYSVVGGITPKEYGPRILKTSNYKLTLTSKNKSQSMITDSMNFEGWNTQTTCFDNDVDVLKHNLNVTEELIKNIPMPEQSKTVSSNFVSKEVDFSVIKKFLSTYKTNGKNSFFNQLGLLYQWIEKNSINEYKKWNVIFAGTKVANNSSWIVAGKPVNKVTRSKLKNYKDFINIAVLTSEEDRKSDMNPIDVQGLSKSEIKEKREKIIRPQLIIYNIDKNSVAKPGLKTRINLDAVEDIIGINIYIPGNSLSNNDVYVTIDMNGQN